MHIYKKLWKRKIHHHGRLVHLFKRQNQYDDVDSSYDAFKSVKRSFRRSLDSRNAKLKQTKRKYPDFKKSMTIQKTREFGRCIKAAQSITVGKVATITRAFASAVKRVINVPYCLTCHKMDIKFISCVKCSMVFFCNSTCENANLTHKYECNTEFHHIADLDVKCAIQIVFEAMATFDTFHELNNFAQTSVKRRNGIPKACNDHVSRLDCIFKLQQKVFKTVEETVEAREIVQNAHRLIINFPAVHEYFELDYKEEGGCFLEHFLAHNVSVIMENAFRINLIGSQGNCDRLLIFDVLSFHNHSCSPNVLTFIDGNVMTCVTSQRILPGEEMFISYRRFKNESRLRRQQELSYWNFVCQCVRCEFERDINFHEFQKAEKLNKTDLERQLDRTDDWTPQKGAFIMKYEKLY